MENRPTLHQLLDDPTLDPQLRALARSLAEIGNEVRRVRGSTLDLHVGDRVLNHAITADADWHEVLGLDGIFTRSLPQLDRETREYLAVHGLQGARGADLRHGHRVRVYVRHGLILFSKRAGPYLPYFAGEVIDLEPDESHSYMIGEEYYAINEYEPRITPLA